MLAMTQLAPPKTDLALPGLSIVLPCLNEAENVVQAVREAQQGAQRVARRHEVIVVDDGSSDGTAKITAALVRADPSVRLVIHSVNRGYGAALKSGIAAARMPWILLTDADLQFDLEQLDAFVPATESSDLVVGWRRQRSDPLGRRVNAAAWNWLVRKTFGIPVHDVDCAFKLGRSDLLQGLNLTSDGAMIDTELLVKAMRHGAQLHELDVRHRPRLHGEQSGANPRVVVRAFVELERLRRTLRSPQTPAAA
jgi:glycosyltransferase involved in cell wall biosynthesis